MKRILTGIIPIFVLLTGCMQSTTAPRDYRAEDAGEIVTALDAGKAVIFADVYYNDKKCASSNVVVRNKKTRHTAIINNGGGQLTPRLMMANLFASVEAGDYWVSEVGCDGKTVEMDGVLGGLLPAEARRIDLFSPQFAVASGDLLHLGVIRINTVKEASWMSDEKVFVTREASAKETKLLLSVRYPGMKDKVKTMRLTGS